MKRAKPQLRTNKRRAHLIHQNESQGTYKIPKPLQAKTSNQKRNEASSGSEPLRRHRVLGRPWGDIPKNTTLNWEWYSNYQACAGGNYKDSKYLPFKCSFLQHLCLFLPSLSILFPAPLTTIHSRFHPYFLKEGDQEVPGMLQISLWGGPWLSISHVAQSKWTGAERHRMTSSVTGLVTRRGSRRSD